MPAQVTEVGPCKRKIAITIPPEQIERTLSNLWREARSQVRMKGFRPGKVPMAVLKRRYGDYIDREAKQQLINEAFRAAIEENDLTPITQPEIDIQSLELEPGKPLELELVIEIRPEFELPEYKGVAVGAPAVRVTDADVEKALEQIRARHASVEETEEGVASKGDFLKADVSYRIDGAVVIHHEDVDVDTNRDRIDGVPVDGGTSAFAGKTVGATVVVPCHLPQDFEPAGYAGLEAELLCTIKAIRRLKLPELTDEFAKEIGAEDLATLREKVREGLRAEFERERGRYIEERVLDELVRATSMEVPVDSVERRTAETLHRIEHEMTASGMDPAEAKAKAASHRERIRADHERALRVQFLVDRIAEAENLRVTDQELEQAIYALAEAHQADVQDVYDNLVESGRILDLRAQILDSKVRKLLRESAQVTESAPESAES